MKYERNALLDDLVEYLHTDERLFYHGHGLPTEFFLSWKPGETEFDRSIEYKKPHSGQTIGRCKIMLYAIDPRTPREDVEVHIEMFVSGYNEWYQMFEGYVEGLDELKLAMKMVGL